MKRKKDNKKTTYSLTQQSFYPTSIPGILDTVCNNRLTYDLTTIIIWEI